MIGILHTKKNVRGVMAARPSYRLSKNKLTETVAPALAALLAAAPVRALRGVYAPFAFFHTIDSIKSALYGAFVWASRSYHDLLLRAYHVKPAVSGPGGAQGLRALGLKQNDLTNVAAAQLAAVRANL